MRIYLFVVVSIEKPEYISTELILEEGMPVLVALSEPRVKCGEISVPEVKVQRD